MDREDNNIESLFQDLVKESGYTGRQTEVIHPHVSDVSFRVNEAINVLRGNIQLSGSNIKTIVENKMAILGSDGEKTEK